MRAKQRPFYTGPRRTGEHPERYELGQYALFTVLLLLLALAGWLYMETTTAADAASIEILHLVHTREALRRDIVVLRAKLAQAESLQRINREADERGYLVVDAADETRHLPIIVDGLAPNRGGEPDQAPSGWWRWLQEQLSRPESAPGGE